MAQFRVVLDGVDLPDDQRDELDRALQKTTLAFLADLDNRGDFAAFYVPKILRPPLAGIWIRPVEDGEFGRFNDIVDLESSVEALNQEILKGVGF
jgi:hypothetical protein